MIKGCSFLAFARRGISCRCESTIQKINKTEPVLSINIHNTVLYFKGNLVTGFSIKWQHAEHLLHCFFSGFPVTSMSPLVGLGC